MKLFHYLLIALFILSCKSNTPPPQAEQKVKTENNELIIPALFEDHKGEYVLAVYESLSERFPVGDERTEYVVEISEDGTLDIFNNDKSSIIYSQIWDESEYDKISKNTIILYEEIRNGSIQLVFKRDDNDGHISLNFNEKMEGEEDEWSRFSSDPSLRGNLAPHQFEDYEDTFSLWTPATQNPELLGFHSFDISSDGTIRYRHENSDVTTIQTWNAKYGRIKQLDSESDFPKLIIIMSNPSETLELYIDLNSSSPYYAKTYEPGLAFFGTNYYGSDVNAGNWGTLTIAGDVVEKIGDSFSPSAPIFDAENDSRTTKFEYTDIKLGATNLKTTLFIEISHKNAVVFATLQTYPEVEGAEIMNCIPDTCIVQLNDVDRTLTFVDATFTESIFADILGLPKAIYNPVLSGTLRY